MHIDLLPETSIVHGRPYPVPRVHMAMFEKELDHLVQSEVLFPVKDT